MSNAAHETRPPFAKRNFFFGPQDEVRAGFHNPQAVRPRLWQCRSVIPWSEQALADHAYGEVGVQALLHALERVHRSLLAELAYRADMYPPDNGTSASTWIGRHDLGLSMPGTVDTTTLRAHLLTEVQIDGGDLDYVILKECTDQFR